MHQALEVLAVAVRSVLDAERAAANTLAERDELEADAVDRPVLSGIRRVVQQTEPLGRQPVRTDRVRMSLCRRIIVTALVAATAMLLPTSARAAGGTLQVMTLSGPVALSGHPLTVHVVIRNPQQQILCDRLFVTLAWTANGSHPMSELITPESPLNVWSGPLSIPAKDVHRGTLAYRVTARQACALFDHGQQFVGASRQSAVRVL